ncbi:MAG: hypothetical protein IH852_08455 [Bacteroidetes bacterium]|nr:hypothetical protein [Bacteroidota bacterium]
MSKEILSSPSESNNSEWIADYIKSLKSNSRGKTDISSLNVLEEKKEIEHRVAELMMRDYIEEASKRNLKLKESKLGFDFYDNCLLIWLEVDDEKSEDKYMEIQKDLNSKYNTHGFQVSSTILSDWEGLPCPDNYTQY